MTNHEKTEYNTTRVGRGYRKFGGEQYRFLYKATMKGSFADNGYDRHVQEVKDKATKLRNQGYKVRVVRTNTAEYLFYTRGERTN